MYCSCHGLEILEILALLVCVPVVTRRVSSNYEASLAVCGPQLFNVMPQYIRDLTNCTVETFKANLDKFLCTVTDQPVIPGYIGGNNQLYGSNSLVDILA